MKATVAAREFLEAAGEEMQATAASGSRWRQKAAGVEATSAAGEVADAEAARYGGDISCKGWRGQTWRQKEVGIE